MTQTKSAAEIREIRALHPDMRERDFARIHSISEGELVAAEVGRSAVRLNADLLRFLLTIMEERAAARFTPGLTPSQPS